MSDTFILPTLEQAAKAEIENKPKTTTGKRGSIFFERERGQGNEAFKEFTTGFGEGITDLKTTGENIGRMIQGKELIPQRGNVFDNVVFSPLDAGIKSYQDGSDFGQNIAKSVDQSSKDFWKNPAREIGRALPAALTFAASFVAPPLAGAKIATTTGKAVSRASQAIGKAKPAAKLGAKGAAKATGKAKSGFTIKAVETTRKQGIGGLSKNVVSGRPGSKTTGKPGGIKKDTSIESGKWYAPQGKTNRPLARGKYAIGDKTNPNKFTTRPRSKARSDKSKGYKKSDPGKLVRKDNILADDIPKGVKIPDKPSELYSKEFVKTVNKAGKLQAKTKQGKLGNRITRETMSPRQTFKPSAMIYQTISELITL